MKKISVLVATVIVAMGITSCGDSHKSASLKTAADSVSYAIGISTGAGYKENLKTLPGDPANVDDLIAGFIQAIKGDSSAMKMTPPRRRKKKAKSSWLKTKRRKTLSRLKVVCSIR